MNTRIEEARPADRDAIVALLQGAGLPTADIGPELLQGFIVARGDTGIEGVAGIESLGRLALLRSLAVAEGLRSRGLGGTLVSAAENLAAARGLAPIYLLTTTAADYFSRRGYQRVARESLPSEVRESREFSSLCPDTATAMVKR